MKEPIGKMSEKPLSPCVDICKIDNTTRTCIGCGRTLDEIAAWGRMSNDERRRAMDIIARRRDKN